METQYPCMLCSDMIRDIDIHLRVRHGKTPNQIRMLKQNMNQLRGDEGWPWDKWDVACKVCVGNLGQHGDRVELKVAFSAFGPVQNIWLSQNPPGFAFLEMEDPRDAEYACKSLDGTEICGMRVGVEMANSSSYKVASASSGKDKGRFSTMAESPPIEFSGSDDVESDEASYVKKKVPLKKVNIPGASKNDPPQGLYEKFRANNMKEIEQEKRAAVVATEKYKYDIGLISEIVAIVYTDPMDDTIYFAGTGEALDFISFPEERRVVWKPPNYLQDAYLSREFCRKLPFNKFHQLKNETKKSFKRQLKTQWKISDLPATADCPEEENNSMEVGVDNDVIHDVEFSVAKKSKGGARKGQGRGGGRAGGSRGRSVPPSGEVTPPSSSRGAGARGKKSQVGRVASQSSRPSFNPPPRKSSNADPVTSNSGTIRVCSLLSEQ